MHGPPWIDDDIDLINVREQACMVHVGNFNEMWWFFPQEGQPFNTRCIIYNYKEGWWSQGEMSRSAGITAPYTAQTIMADGLVVFEHELGDFYGNAQLPWAETFDLNLTSGAQLITVKQMIPDATATRFGPLYSLFYRNSRSTERLDSRRRSRRAATGMSTSGRLGATFGFESRWRRSRF